MSSQARLRYLLALALLFASSTATAQYASNFVVTLEPDVLYVGGELFVRYTIPEGVCAPPLPFARAVNFNNGVVGKELFAQVIFTTLAGCAPPGTTRMSLGTLPSVVTHVTITPCDMDQPPLVFCYSEPKWEFAVVVREAPVSIPAASLLGIAFLIFLLPVVAGERFRRGWYSGRHHP